MNIKINAKVVYKNQIWRVSSINDPYVILRSCCRKPVQVNKNELNYE